MSPRSAHVLVALAAMGAVVLPGAPASASDGCAHGVDASWSTHYSGGRYTLDALTIDGLAGCAGATVEVVISAAGYPLAEVRASVSDDVLVIDLTDEQIAAARVDELDLALTVVAPVDDPTTDPVMVAPAHAERGDEPGGSVDAAVEHGALPVTGVDGLWLIALAAALTIGGVALRRRRDGGHDA
jgi:hypothetical protein